MTLLWTATCVAVGCARDPSIDPSNLPPVPHGLEPAVAAHLEESRELLSSSAPGVERSEAWGRMGMTAQGYQRLELATRCYRRAEELAPGDFRWPYYLGRTLLDAGDAELAVAAFRRALEIRPGEPWASLGLGQALLELGGYDEARTTLDGLVAAHSDRAIAWLALGDAHQGLGDAESAIEAFRQVLRLQPRATRVHVRLADAYRSAGDLESARREVESSGEGRVAYRDPWMLVVMEGRQGTNAALETGRAAFDAGRFEEAAAAFGRATELDPERASAWLNLGAARLALGSIAEATAAFEIAESLDPSDPNVHFNLGTLHSREGRYEEAVARFERALALDPGHEGAAVNLGNAWLRAGHCARAAGRFEETLTRNPSLLEARLGLVVALSCSDRDAEALRRVEEGLRATPRDRRLRNALARLLAAGRGQGLRNGDRAAAEAIQLVEEETPLEFVETVAMSLAAAGRFEEASEWQTRALAAAEGAGRTEWAETLRVNLARYRAGQSAERPWPMFETR